MSTRRDRLRAQVQEVMPLWWRCTERGLIKGKQRRAIETKLENLSLRCGLDFYRTPPAPGQPIFIPLLGKNVPRSTVLRDATLLASLDSKLERHLKEQHIQPEEFAKRFFNGLGDFEYASIPQKVKQLPLQSDRDVLTLLKPITSTDKFKYSLQYVLFDPAQQRAVATDGFALVALPWQVQHTTDRVLHPTTGEQIDEQYPNWQSVVPRIATVESTPLSLQRLIDRLPALVRLTPIYRWWHKRPKPYGLRGLIEFGTHLTLTFASTVLLPACRALRAAGVEKVVLRGVSPERAMLIADVTNARRFALVMPVRPGGDDPKGQCLHVSATTQPSDFTGMD